MLASFEPFSEFRVTAQHILEYLHEQLGFSLWMVTRTEGDDWIVLQAEDHGYGVKEGDVFLWTDSFCSQMVQGKGPCVAPDAKQVPAYATAPIGQQVPIAAYIGLPLTKPDGTLFGTLCAIDPQVQPDTIKSQLPQLTLLSRLLGTVLASELKAEAETRRAERAEAEAETDALTHLYNRRGWDRLLDAEEARCHRYGHVASVLLVDLDNFKTINDEQGHDVGDLMLQNAAAALSEGTRDCDVVARLGGDEFAVLAVHCDQSMAVELKERIQDNLSKVNLHASIGMAVRNPAQSLEHASIQADKHMYACKRAKQTEPIARSSKATMSSNRRNAQFA
ncbi:sensor domain-containing diguanylate cyclase [Novipirellula artificiosorum]|uniref:diguanylate cyclase n=1 Tax=Novipirellula artificiosorum TaxID=2528016 RepID=A0A5C6DEB5_9BACT|nr:sensor domain-containing diguanylate cyclase [Novipirellula artificiosorum]TWU35008.1 putative diguanylate cyclase YeaP [Novipirellula artificiosorum]